MQNPKNLQLKDTIKIFIITPLNLKFLLYFICSKKDNFFVLLRNFFSNYFIIIFEKN